MQGDDALGVNKYMGSGNGITQPDLGGTFRGSGNVGRS
jgi:hypothetical protein